MNRQSVYPGGRRGNNSQPHAKIATGSGWQGEVVAIFGWGRELLSPPAVYGENGGVTPQFFSCLFDLFHSFALFFGQLHKGTPHYTRTFQKNGFSSPTPNRYHLISFVKTSAPGWFPSSRTAVLTDFLKNRSNNWKLTQEGGILKLC